MMERATKSPNSQTQYPSAEHKLSGRSSANARSLLILMSITLVCLVPFLDKAFNVDDPLFLWAGQHITNHPLDFYGFYVNWFGKAMPMPDAMFNPPMTSYFMALVGSIAGWSEIALHTAFLLYSLAVVWGTYTLAQRFCARPFLAAGLALFAPAFLVSSTTVMSDVPMLACWVWAVYFWVRGLDENSSAHLVVAALLISIGFLTKYFCVSLVPLLFAYTLLREKRLTWRTTLLAIPVATVFGYEILGNQLYGHPLFLSAFHFTSSINSHVDPISKLLVGLSFAGGSVLTISLVLPLVFRSRTVVILSLALILAAALITFPYLSPFSATGAHRIAWTTTLQFALFVTIGATVFGLAVLDLARHKDPSAVLLTLWIVGTFVFAGFLNWTTNVRTFLPAVPAVAILITRAIDRQASQFKVGTKLVALMLGCAACISLALAWADYRWANSVRIVANNICRQYDCAKNTVWIDGHWGFQYYMQLHGAHEADWANGQPPKGSLISFPVNTNYAFMPVSKAHFQPLHTFVTRPWPGVATMDKVIGAGFYTTFYGPLPFAIGSTPPDKYMVARFR